MNDPDRRLVQEVTETIIGHCSCRGGLISWYASAEMLDIEAQNNVRFCCECTFCGGVIRRTGRLTKS